MRGGMTTESGSAYSLKNNRCRRDPGHAATIRSQGAPSSEPKLANIGHEFGNAAAACSIAEGVRPSVAYKGQHGEQRALCGTCTSPGGPTRASPRSIG
jgi:hypothetical protein